MPTTVSFKQVEAIKMTNNMGVLKEDRQNQPLETMATNDHPTHTCTYTALNGSGL